MNGWNNSDGMDVFFDALISGDFSGAIERSEKRGQNDFVASERLPIRVNGGVNTKDAKTQYEKMGITVIDKSDDLFYNVMLPNGWKKESTGHSMWNNLLDEQGRIRATIFYKAAFYDRDAFINFERRYNTAYEPFDISAAEGLSYSDEQLLPYCGVIKDGSAVIWKTKPETAKTDREAYDLHSQLQKLAIKHLKTLHPNFEDVNAYWED
jgi:hypothetical protein